MLRLTALIFAMMGTAGCAAQGTALSFPEGAQHLLAVRAVPDLLKQCSRPVPQAVSDHWLPTPTQVQAVEAALPRIGQGLRAAGVDPLPSGAYARQYGGIVQNGVLKIYVNFAAAQGGWRMDPAQDAIVACGGGAAFWGAVYNLANGQFEQFSVNGGK